WQHAIRNAVQNGAFFIACFSKAYHERTSTYMNEELLLAVEEIRQRHFNRPWFIPVLLNKCDVPEIDIGAGRTLKSLQWVKLYHNRVEALKAIVAAVQPLLSPATQVRVLELFGRTRYREARDLLLQMY